jgi:hypothetical protein
MKKIGLLCALLFCAAAGSSAQEAKSFTLGLGVEGNMNTRSGMAAGGSLSAFFGLNRLFSLGVRAVYSHNFDLIMVAEPEALFRWYILPLGRTVLFFQGDLGSSLIFEEGELFPVIMGGLTAGIRFPLGPLYLEPSVRGGYPFIWGAGITAVYRLGRTGPAVSPEGLIRR